jgi:hypothetical protein
MRRKNGKDARIRGRERSADSEEGREKEARIGEKKRKRSADSAGGTAGTSRERLKQKYFIDNQKE